MRWRRGDGEPSCLPAPHLPVAALGISLAFIPTLGVASAAVAPPTARRTQPKSPGLLDARQRDDKDAHHAPTEVQTSVMRCLPSAVSVSGRIAVPHAQQGCVPSRRVRTNRAIHSLASCCDAEVPCSRCSRATPASPGSWGSQLQPAIDLLRGPAALQLLDHDVTQRRIGSQLARLGRRVARDQPARSARAAR